MRKFYKLIIIIIILITSINSISAELYLKDTESSVNVMNPGVFGWIYMNYSTNNNSIYAVQLKHGTSDSYNVTDLPSGCINQNPFMLAALSRSTDIISDSYWQCYNGTNWVTIGNYFSTQSCYSSDISGTYTNQATDNDWNTYGIARSIAPIGWYNTTQINNCEESRIYEAGLWLNYTTPSCVGITKEFRCGDTITESCIFNGNITNNNSEYCFYLNTSNIIIDGNGYYLLSNTSNDVAFNTSTSFNNITIKNINFGLSWRNGIQVNGGSNLTLYNNIFITNSTYNPPTFINNHKQLTAINNTFNEGLGVHFYLVNVSDSYFANNTHNVTNPPTGTTAYYFINNSNNNILDNIYIFGDPTSINAGVIFGIIGSSSVFNNTFYNSNITTTNIYNVMEMMHGNNSFINTTIDIDKSYFYSSGTGQIYKKWYLYNIYVNDSYGNPIPNAIINIYDKNNNLIITDTTNSTGYTGQYILTEYYRNYTGAYYSTNYTINVSKTGYNSNTKTLNLTSSQSIFITLQPLQSTDLIITSVTPPLNPNPAEETITTTYTIFNVTFNDANLINDSSALCKYTKNGEPTITSSSCIKTNINTTDNSYNCTLIMQYYYAPSTWNVNCSISNNGATKYAENTTETFNYGSLSALKINETSVSFGSLLPGAINQPSLQNPNIKNTGNIDYSSINLTIHELTGIIDDTKTIAPNNFKTNNTDNASLQQLQDGTNTLSITLPRGLTTKNIYYFINVPIGTYAQSYKTNATNAWVIQGVE